MLSKVIRAVGLIVIIGFCTMSIFLFQLQRQFRVNELPPSFKKTMLTYPTFFEDNFYDLRMKMTMNPEKKDDRIVLLAIDDLALKTLGRWPWSRFVWGPLLDKLALAGPKQIAFDAVFPEPERPSNGRDPDAEFRDALKRFHSTGNKTIVSYSLSSTYAFDDSVSHAEVPGELYDFVLNTGQLTEGALGKHRISNTTFPIPKLLEAAPGLAFIGANEDPDGIFRRYMVLANVDDIFFPSFSLLSYMYATGDSPTLKRSADSEYFLEVGKNKLFLDETGATKVRWLGTDYNFPAVSMKELHEDDFSDPKIIEKWSKLVGGKHIFIGSTAFAAHDLRHTPVDAKMPGVYFHMNMLHMLLDGKFFKPQLESLKYSWLLLIVGTLLMVVISLRKNPILDISFVLVFSGVVFYWDTYYLITQGYELTLFFVLLSVIGTYSWNTFLNFYLANKDKQFLKNAFGNYISPELIDEMYTKGEPPKLGGDVGVRTAFFTDIQSFSSFSEKLSAPQLVELLNEYLTDMTDILLAYKGTLDKYEGDAIIAFFGAPMPLEDHAKKALQVALQMQYKLDDLRVKWRGEGDKWPQIVKDMRMRIGVNSGEIVTGNMGSKSRMNYTMMGDSVNLAARLESSAKQYGIFTQISENTKNLVNGEFVMRELDTVRVVGKSEPITTFELLGEVGKTEKVLLDLKEHFEQGLKFYKEKKWAEAKAAFQKSLEDEYTRFPELKGVKTNPSLIYIERCEEFEKSPPPADWDGVYNMDSK